MNLRLSYVSDGCYLLGRPKRGGATRAPSSTATAPNVPIATATMPNNASNMNIPISTTPAATIIRPRSHAVFGADARGWMALSSSLPTSAPGAGLACGVGGGCSLARTVHVANEIRTGLAVRGSALVREGIAQGGAANACTMALWGTVWEEGETDYEAEVEVDVEEKRRFRVSMLTPPIQ